MKVIGIFILSLLLTLSTLSTANDKFSEMEKTSKVFTIDCDQKHPSVDIEIEDDKIYMSSSHAPYRILTDKVDNEEKAHFQYSTFSLLKPPKILFA